MKVKLTLAALTLSAGVMIAGEVKINNIVPKDCPVEENDQGWSYVYTCELKTKELAGAELRLSAGGWKKHPTAGHIAGYNGDINLKINAPGPVVTLKMNCGITNYADAAARKVFIAYSLNGVDFHELEVKEFKSGTAKLDACVKLPVNRGFLYLRFGRYLEKGDSNGRHGFVLFNKIGFTLVGTIPPVVKTEGREVVSEASKGLKAVFPTGVFWAWECTKRNADAAGMDLWQFTDSQMKQLKEHGCNTLWFVNMPQNVMPKILMMAEKYGLKVLLNSGLVEAFYHDAGSLDRLNLMAGNTVSRIGDFPALLGYVLKDEPLLCSLETCNYFYDLMKRADPLRDSVVVAMNRQSMTFLKESKLPVVCTDIYYFGHDKSTNIPNPTAVSQTMFSEGLDGYNTAAELYGKHFWFMGQIYAEIWGRHYLKDGKCIVEPGSYLHWRMPTVAETRWQAWEAVRNGSKGVLFFVLLPRRSLNVLPDQVKLGTPEAKVVANMDKMAKIAAGWKHQWLTEKRMEIDPGEAIVLLGGRPTPQMAAMGKAFRTFRSHEKLLLAKKRAAFPVFFSASPSVNTATFDTGDGKRYGVVVNRDLNKVQEVEILLPLNVASIKNLNTEQELPVVVKNENFRKVVFPLDAGDGVLLEASFVNGVPGMPICHESFDQQSIHRVKLNSNAQIFNHGNYGVDAFRSVRLNGDPSQPLFTLENLTNRKSARNTFSLNLNKEKRDGTIYCLLNGRLSSAAVKAVSSQGDGEKTNIAHLADSNFKGGEKSTAEKNIVIQEDDFGVPAVVPVGTTSLEFYLTDPSDHIAELTVWFVPDVK